MKYIEKVFDELTKELCQIMKQKNSDYAGDQSEFFNFEVAAMLAHITVEQDLMDKIATKITRLSNLLLKKDPAVRDESMEDTLKDLINYAIIWYAYRMYKHEEAQKEKEEPNRYTVTSSLDYVELR